ncbi:30S ribosomal protein S20 [Buchnera aphidicola]|uniref:Small ribosomal subunit protein bS20 n=1 Tax=Buchnera aphidicola subsp. Tuberolachnus salignus TaxID=98804 RepID=A0A160SX94_BUCTT|nr:30S ribosomal protein S20 [Buchnera aphidicola]CUR53085.1 30S ribosomal protein S20 [Buchnera aphidicola (Tuberolachnus salignus)]
MANIKSSKKRAISSERQRKLNVSKKSRVKTFIKKVLISIKKVDLKEAKKNFIIMQSILDKSVSKKIFHKNKAARYKSNLSFKIKNLKHFK